MEQSIGTTRSHTTSSRSMVGEIAAAEWRVSVSEQGREVGPCIDPTIREDRSSLGRSGRVGYIGSRDALDAANASDVDRQADEELRAVLVLLHTKLESTIDTAESK